MAPEKKDWELTQPALEKVLRWLDKDLGKAGEKYEEIRAALIGIFIRRGCSNAEELADTTIDRVIRKLDVITGDYHGDPALYFYGVAQMVQLEYLRRQYPPVEQQSPTPQDYTQQDYDCLEKCLAGLTTANRQLIEFYYQGDRESKMTNRKGMAKALGVSLNVLRVRAHRVRDHLRKCLEECRKREASRRGLSM